MKRSASLRYLHRFGLRSSLFAIRMVFLGVAVYVLTLASEIGISDQTIWVLVIVGCVAFVCQTIGRLKLTSQTIIHADALYARNGTFTLTRGHLDDAVNRLVAAASVEKLDDH
jgi:hypothetical protein